MAYSFKSSISFGLVYIPIKLTAAAKSRDIGFNMLEKKTGKRVRFKRVADGTDREVKLSDTVKGYEYDKDKYVTFDEDDFEKLKTKNDKTVNITAFVDLNEIDPVYYEKTYYVTPAGGEKAFALLIDAMRETGRVGISKTVLGTKECLVALRADGENLLLSTLYFYDEISPAPRLKPTDKPQKRERELAASMIEALNAPFEPQSYRNDYNDRLKAAIEDKINGKEIVTADDTKDKSSDSDSLLAALLASVSALGGETAGV